MELAPIAIFSYNRPDHLKQTLEALSKNDLATESVLYIFCDGPKGNATEEMKQRIAENVAFAQSQLWPKELHVVAQEKNLGLADSIISGVTDVVNRHGRIIMLEDDIITSRGFLRYMNDALEMYKDEEKVMHVCGYMFPVKHEKWLPETFFHPVPYPGGGWGTWARAWNHYDNDIQAHYAYWSQNWRRFNVWGSDLQKQLTMNYTGQLKTWFIRWFASMRKMDGLTLYPHHSLTTNIGFDGSGDNCPDLQTNKYWVDKLTESINVKKVKIISNRLAIHEMYVFWSGHWYSKRHRDEWKRKVKELICNYK